MEAPRLPGREQLSRSRQLLERREEKGRGWRREEKEKDGEEKRAGWCPQGALGPPPMALLLSPSPLPICSRKSC